jgi:hypothetical protein
MSINLLTGKRSNRNWSISILGDEEKIASEKKKIVFLMASGLAVGLAGMAMKPSKKIMKPSLLVGGIGLLFYGMYRTATNHLPLG